MHEASPFFGSGLFLCDGSDRLLQAGFDVRFVKLFCAVCPCLVGIAVKKGGVVNERGKAFFDGSCVGRDDGGVVFHEAVDGCRIRRADGEKAFGAVEAVHELCGKRVMNGEIVLRVEALCMHQNVRILLQLFDLRGWRSAHEQDRKSTR